MLVRSFAVQGSWNYRTLLGTGFAFTLLPALRALHRGDPAALDRAVARHTQLFNCHPYLAAMAVGAVARMEAEGSDPALIDRFKAAVRGSLGTLGDRLVWAGWRPVCLLLALALVLLGVPGGVAALFFLVLYNAGHFWLRWWSLRIGVSEGRAVGERLRRSGLPESQRRLGSVGAFLAGFVLPLVAAGGLLRVAPASLWLVLAALAVIGGIRFGSLVRGPVMAALIVLALAGMLIGVWA